MPIHRSDERRIQIQLLLELVRLVVPSTGSRGLRFELSEILSAIALGELEGRPFQASKLAEFIGMPRATLLRRLRGLERDGYIVRRSGHYFANPDRINSPDMDGLTDRITSMIAEANAKLQGIKKG